MWSVIHHQCFSLAVTCSYCELLSPTKTAQMYHVVTYLGSRNLNGSLGYCFLTFSMSSPNLVFSAKSVDDYIIRDVHNLPGGGGVVDYVDWGGALSFPFAI